MKATLNYLLSHPQKGLVYDIEKGNSRFRNVIKTLDDAVKVDTYKVDNFEMPHICEHVKTKHYEKGTDFGTLLDVEG